MLLAASYHHGAAACCGSAAWQLLNVLVLHVLRLGYSKEDKYISIVKMLATAKTPWLQKRGFVLLRSLLGKPMLHTTVRCLPGRPVNTGSCPDDRDMES